MLYIDIHFCSQEDRHRESRYKPNILEVFMFKGTSSCNSSAWIQTEHFLERNHTEVVVMGKLHIAECYLITV